jgi:Catechol dioxygenase N terminus
MPHKDFTEDSATEIVLSRMGSEINPRLREVMTSIITHVHAIVREIEPTQDEWMQAITFLTRTGQLCDDVRQEFILLADTLGVSRGRSTRQRTTLCWNQWQPAPGHSLHSLTASGCGPNRPRT